MAELMKDKLIYSIVTAESIGKIRDQKARYVSDQMRLNYGGHWSVWGNGDSGYLRYIRPVVGRLAVFDYNGQRWNVYDTDCSKSIKNNSNDRRGVSGRPDIVFDDGHMNMEQRQKDTIVDAITEAENLNIVGQDKADHIGERMERDYGSTWSIHAYVRDGVDIMWYESPSYAVLKYQGKSWYVYMNDCS